MTPLLNSNNSDRAAVHAALRVVVPYVLFAVAWIWLSDRLLLSLAPDIEHYNRYSILKGAFFVAASATMLFVLLRNELSARGKVERDRQDLLGREQAARARAESASRAKDELLAMVSHELRTPLTAILSSAEVLQTDPTLSEENRELAQMIAENVLQESRVVGDLLDCSSLASGKFDLRFDRTDMHEIIQMSIAELRPEITLKQLVITLDLGADPQLVSGDKLRLGQAIRHLLSNSIKFTPDHGTIRLTTSATAEQLTVELRDSGIGMTAEVRERLFRPFAQGDGSITRRYGGLGIGLYLAKSIIELHGGQLSATSEGSDKGSTFRIELPTWAGEAASPGPQQRSLECDGMSVLLVEDNIDTLRVLGRLLGKLGCTVMAARSGAEAIEIAGRERIDLIVSDIGLPDLTGWEVMKQLRQKHDIKGIAISGFDTEEDRKRSKDAGFLVHLVKPISFPLLQSSIVEIFTSQRKARDVTERPPAALATPAPDRASQA